MYETHVCMKTINRHTLTNNTVTRELTMSYFSNEEKRSLNLLISFHSSSSCNKQNILHFLFSIMNFKCVIRWKVARLENKNI